MRLVLMKPGLEKVKSGLPFDIRLDPRHTRPLSCIAAPSIRDRYRKPLTFLHSYRRRRQFQVGNIP